MRGPPKGGPESYISPLSPGPRYRGVCSLAMRDLDKGSKIPGAVPVRERQFEVRDFLGVRLARFEDGLDLTDEGPLEECR